MPKPPTINEVWAGIRVGALTGTEEKQMPEPMSDNDIRDIRISWMEARSDEADKSDLWELLEMAIGDIKKLIDEVERQRDENARR